MKKNRYKATHGNRQIFVVAQSATDAERIARPLLHAPHAVIKIQYVGHA